MRARSAWLSHPKLKATWVALAAGSLAGLAVVGACSQDSAKIVGTRPVPESPRLTGVVGGNAHLVKVCSDLTSTGGPVTVNVSFQGGLLETNAVDPDRTNTYQYNFGPYAVPDVITSQVTISPNECKTVFQRNNSCPAQADCSDPLQHLGNRLWTNESNTSSPPLGGSGTPPQGAVSVPWPNIPQIYSGIVNPRAGVFITAVIPNGYTLNSLVCTNDDNTLPQSCVNGGYSSANVFHGSTFTYKFTAPSEPPPTCVLGYPFTSSVARTSTIFNESSVLSSFGRGPKPGDATIDQIRVWSTDEHALTLGLRASIQKNKVAPTLVTTPYNPFSAFPVLPNGVTTSSASPVGIGSTATSGVGAAIDGSGRPLYPALFVTDITGITDQSTTNTAVRLGDWQYGGTPITPDGIWGTWKGAFRLVDNTKATPTTTLDVDDDPDKNHKVVGPGGVNPGALAEGDVSPAGVQDLGFSAEIVWNINTLKTIKFPPVGGNADPATWQFFDPSIRSYRLQFMVHDGDQNKTGGDVGQACMNIGPGTTTNFATIVPLVK